MQERPSIKYDFALVVAVLVWGFNIPIMKMMLREIHPHVMNSFRLWMALLVLGILHHIHQNRTGQTFFAPLRTHTKPLVALGFFGFLCYQIIFVSGVKYTDAGSVALILACSPLWIALASHVLSLDRILTLDWVGLLTAFIGVGVVVVGGTAEIDFSNETFLGNVLILAASGCWATYTVLSKTMTEKLSPASIAFFGLFLSIPLLTILGMINVDSVEWATLSGWVWLGIIFSGSIAIGVNMTLWTTAVKHVGPAYTAIYANFVPLITLVSGFLLLDEPIVPIQVVGGVLILAGLFIMRQNRTHASRDKNQDLLSGGDRKRDDAPPVLKR